MSDIAKTAKIHPNVRLGAGVRVDDWVIVGLPPAGTNAGDLETVIGDGAVIRSHSVIYAGSQFGRGFQTGHHAIVGPGMKIGAGCSIGTNSFTAGFAELRDGARLHGLGYLGEFASIHENAWVGPYAMVESDLDRITVVAAGAILALHVHLLAGVRVGERALLGTRSLINKDIPPYRLVVGHPPRAIRTIDQIVSPLAEIGRPYKADPPELQQVVLARHAVRDGCSIDADDWRLEMWRRLTKSPVQRAAPKPARTVVGPDLNLHVAPAIMR